MDKSRWVEMYESGMSAFKIADEVGVCASTVYKYFTKIGQKMRSQKETSKLYECDENFFEKIDTEKKAYWLGFFYADGYVLSNTDAVAISLKSTDRCHLEKLKEIIGSTYPISDYTSTTSYGKVHYSRFRVGSAKLKNDLIKNGCVANKSLILTFPSESILPKELTWHFIRGYFDGDGSLTNCKGKQWNVKICGTYEFLSGLSNFSLEEIRYIYKEKRNDKNNYVFNFGNKNKLEKFLDLMYENATIYLNRKHEKYLKMKNYLNETEK